MPPPTKISEFLPEFNKARDYNLSTIVPRIETNRSRRVDVADVAALRKSGQLDLDESLITLRIIDENIGSEIPSYIKYLVGSPRVAIFKDTQDSESTNEQLEQDFTRVFRYKNWVRPFHLTVDCSVTHGLGALEVNHNEDMPGKFSTYYISRERLIFPVTNSLESAQFVCIKLSLTCVDLERMRLLSGFNTQLITKALEDKKEDKAYEFTAYKVYQKCEGIVYLSFHLKEQEEDWLYAPQLFNNGVMTKVTTPQLDPMGMPMVDPMGKPIEQIQWTPVKETLYPIFPYQYKVTEDECIMNAQGRAEIDYPKQEAQVTCITAFVNAALKASASYFSTDKHEPERDIALLDLQMQRNRVVSQPIRSFNHAYPSMDLIRAANAIDVRTKSEMGHTSWSADNRVDSRKTKAEVDVSAAREQELESVNILLFSLWTSEVLNYVWRIVQSAALMGKINVGQMVVSTDPITGREITGPNEILLTRTYQLLPAGDVDVIQKEESIRKRKEMWPLIAGNPALAVEFMVDLMKDMFPKDAKRYEQVIRQSVQQQQQVPALIEMIEGLLELPQNQQIAQQFAPQLQQLKQSVIR